MDWNIEHMNSWWTGGGQPTLRESFAGNAFSPAIGDVPGLARRCAELINAVDPDVVALQEAAGQPELEEFFSDLVSGQWTVIRGAGGAQALAVAARSDRIAGLTEGPTTIGQIDLSVDLVADVDADGLVNSQDFARDPQVVIVDAGAAEILLINNHLKSKFVRDGQRQWEAGGADQLAFVRDALIARRRISAEAYRIRQFLDAALAEDEDRHIVVTGDLNDGAGADFFEERYLTHSVVDRIFGSVFFPGRQLKHVLFHTDGFDLSVDFTAQFHDYIAGEQRDLVLDHIGLSPSLDRLGWDGRVAAQEYVAATLSDAAMTAGGFPDRDRRASDHRPVVVDVQNI